MIRRNRIDELIHQPIPQVQEPDTSRVEIHDCGEPLVPLRSIGSIRVASAYSRMNYDCASSALYLRIGAATALFEVADSLPEHLRLVIWDGFRPLQLQAEIRARFARHLRASGVPTEQLESRVDEFVSPLPSDPEQLRHSPPAHATGGAVDLTLGDPDGRELDLGQFDDFSETALPDRYERGSSCPNLLRRTLRRILFHSMTQAGFVCYHSEWWHYEIGTRRAAAAHFATIARYGLADLPAGALQHRYA